MKKLFFLPVLVLILNFRLSSQQFPCAKEIYKASDLCAISSSVLYNNEILFLTNEDSIFIASYPDKPNKFTNLKLVSEKGRILSNIDSTGTIPCGQITLINITGSKLALAYESYTGPLYGFNAYYYEYANDKLASKENINSQPANWWASPTLVSGSDNIIRLANFASAGYFSILSSRSVSGIWNTCTIRNDNNSIDCFTANVNNPENSLVSTINSNNQMQLLRVSNNNLRYTVIPSSNSGNLLINQYIDLATETVFGTMFNKSGNLTVLYQKAGEIFLGVQNNPNSSNWNLTNLKVLDPGEQCNFNAKYYYYNNYLYVAYFNMNGNLKVKRKIGNSIWEVVYERLNNTKYGGISLIEKNSELYLVFMDNNSVYLVNLNYATPFISKIILSKSEFCEGENCTIKLIKNGGKNPIGGSIDNSRANWLDDSTIVINNLVASDSKLHTIKLTDSNGCVTEKTVNIKVNDKPVISETFKNVSCHNGMDGAIFLNIINGTSPYRYVWNTGIMNNAIQNIPAGDYSVTVTDSKTCGNIKNFKVTQPPELRISAIIDSSKTGNDGRIVLNVSGGTPNYSYGWSNGGKNNTIANLSAGKYFVTITDINGCVKDTFFNIYSKSPWPIVCKGGNIHYVALDYKKLESSSFGTTNTPLEKGDWIGIFYRKKDGSYVCTDAQVVGDLTQSGGLQLKACGETSPGADDGFEINEPLYYQVLKGQTTYYANELITSYHERFSLNNGTYPDGYDKFEGSQLISLIKSIRTVDLSSNPDCNAPILLRCGDKLRNQDNRRGTNNTIVYNCIRNKVDGPELIFTFIHADKKDVRIVIDNLQNSGSSDLELFLMDKCDKDHCIAYSAKTGSSPESLIVRDLPVGTYYIIVDGYFGSESTFDISIECGDFPDDDYSVPGGGSGSGGPVINPKNCGDNFTDNTLNGERKKSSYSPCTNRYYPGREKIYTINFNKKGYVYLYVTPIDNDVDVFILDKYAANSCIAESTQSGLEEELVTFPVEANKNYYVIVDEFATDKGCNFKLRYDCYMTSSGGGGGGTSAPCYAKCDTMPKLDCGLEYQGNTALGRACKSNWYPCNNQGAKGNPGKEVIYLFENKTTQDVIFNVYDLKEDLNVYILDTCVGTCYKDWNTKKTGASAEAFIIQAMPPGIYNVIIDTYVSGNESPFKIRLDCSKTSNPCFDIKVPKGLSYISSPIKPTDPAIDFLLPDAKFNGKIDVITNDKMISYAPGFTSLPSSSALSKWSVEDGYKVLSSEASVINVCGELADSAKIKSVIAKEAKGKLFQHYISYPFMYKQKVVTAFGDSAKSFASQVIKFFPDNAQPPLSYNFNSKLGDNFEMEPGIGYVLKVNRDGKFSYRTKEIEYVPNGCDYFKTELRETSSHAWIKIPKYAIQQALKIGSEVGVFTNTGLLVGSGKFEGENLLITIQGNNVNTKDVEGFNPNEPINLKFYDLESKTEKEMHVIWKTSNLFQENTVFEISLVTKLESNSVEGIQIYPNPAKDLVYIDLRSVNGKVESLSLFNSRGVKLEELKHINQKQIIEYQCNSCPSGIYYIQVNTNQSSSTKKLILIK